MDPTTMMLVETTKYFFSIDPSNGNIVMTAQGTTLELLPKDGEPAPAPTARRRTPG
jgi:hypothetical protein